MSATNELELKPVDPEKGSFNDDNKVDEGRPEQVAVADGQYQFDVRDFDRVQRRLKQRHIQMIAIAGTIGTGLFLGSGQALSSAGPLGALIAYGLVGSTAYSTLCSLGEMTTHAPISGTFPHFAARWVDPAFGFAVGWNYFYSNMISIPVEITAATILLSLWDTNLKHQAGYIAMMVVLVCSINIFGVRWFGESEFVFSIIKLLLITGLILLGLIIDLGGTSTPRIGFRYWKNPGAIAPGGFVKNPNTDRFLGILNVIVQAAFSYQGMELVAVAASETESPRRNVAKAVNRVFYRIIIFYMLGILIIGMLVPYNDPNLLTPTNPISESPFVIAITRAGIKGLPSVLNAAIFTSAFSAGNSFLFCSSRILYGLALRGQAPRYLTYCTKKGLPLFAVLTSAASAFLAFMSVSSGASTVFNWLVSLSATAGFFGWCSINITYLFFHKGMRAQGYDLKKNIYHSRFQPYVAWWGALWTGLFIFVSGFSVFFNIGTASQFCSKFFSSYVNILIFSALYGGYKIFKRTKVWKPLDMDFVTGIPSVEETEKPLVPPANIWEKIADVLF